MKWRVHLFSADLEAYAEIYRLHERLGFATPEAAWAADPVVQGSVNPSDYRIVP